MTTTKDDDNDTDVNHDYAFGPSFFFAADFTRVAHTPSQARERTAAFRTRFHASKAVEDCLSEPLSLAAWDVTCSSPVSGRRNLPGRPHKPSFYNTLGAGGSMRL